MTEASSDSVANVLKSANEAATVARGIYLALMSVGAFLLLVAAGLTDHRLLLNGSVPLPLIEKTELPLSVFFGFGPWLFVLVYAECLMHFLLLAEKLAVFNGALDRMIASERRRERTQLSNFLFSHWLSREDPDPVVHFFQAAVVVSTLVVLPIVAIVYCQLACMPLQSEAVTWSQRLAALASIVLLAVFWPKIVAPSMSRSQWWLGHIAFLRKVPSQGDGTRNAPGRLHGWIIALLAALTAQIAFVSATIPYESWERFVLRVNSALGGSTVLASDRYYHLSLLGGAIMLTDKSDIEGWLTTIKVDVPQEMSTFATTAALFHSSVSPFRRTLSIRGRNLSSSTSPSLPSGVAPKEEGASKLQDDAIQNIDLRGRNLRFADFNSVAVSNVDLRGADLRGATFMESALYDVDLSDATATGIHFRDSALVRSKLTRAKLKGSRFERISAHGLIAEQAVFVASHFSNTRLNGADLAKADFTGAFLYRVSLRQAVLSRIKVDHLVAYDSDFRDGKGLPNDIIWHNNVVEDSKFGKIPESERTELEVKAGPIDWQSWYLVTPPSFTQTTECVHTKGVGCMDRMTEGFAMAYVNALIALACNSRPNELSAMVLRYRGWIMDEPLRWMPIKLGSTRFVSAEPLLRRFDETLQKGTCSANERALIGWLPIFFGRYLAEPAAPRVQPEAHPSRRPSSLSLPASR